MPGRSLPTEMNLGLVGLGAPLRLLLNIGVASIGGDGLAVPSSLIPGVDEQLMKCNPSNPIRTRNKSFETSFVFAKKITFK